MLHAPISETTADTAAGKGAIPAIRGSEGVRLGSLIGSGYRSVRSNHLSQAFDNAQSTCGNQAVLRALNRQSDLSHAVLQRKCACDGTVEDCSACADRNQAMSGASFSSQAPLISARGVTRLIQRQPKPTAPTAAGPGSPSCIPRTGTTEYGCYCGAGTSCSSGLTCTPANALDACCRQHDLDYGGCSFVDRYNPFSRCYATTRAADVRLCLCALEQAGRLHGASERYRAGVIGLFCPTAQGEYFNTEALRGTSPLLQRKFANDGSRESCNECERKEAALHRHTEPNAQPLVSSSPLENGIFISQPGDPSEQEADQIADRVLRNFGQAVDPIPVRAIPRQSSPRPAAHRGGAQSDHLVAPTETAAEIRGLSGGGRALPETLRQTFEQSFGFDLTPVRIHTDPESASISNRLQATAFTFGSDIFFGAGEYQPETANGLALLAHELAHVVQQGAGTLERASIQRAKVPYRKLTWADFKKTPPDDSSYAAETASTFDPAATDKTARPTSESTKNKCQIDGRDATEYKATVASDSAPFDKIAAYMTQEESWVKADKKDNGAKRCPAEVTTCEQYFDDTTADVKTKCDGVVADCQKRFADDPDTDGYTLGEEGDQVRANSAAECATKIRKKCQDDAMKQAETSLTDDDGKAYATAKKKSDCKTTFKTACVTYETAQTAALLKHEQGHFDITKVMADKAKASLKAKAKTLTATEVACGKTEAIAAAQATYDALDAPTVLSQLQQDWIDAMNNAQTDYDNETDHGAKKVEQATWEKYIADGLTKYDPTAPATQPAGPSAPTSVPAPTP